MLFILECIGVVHFGLLWPDFVLLFFAFPFAKVRNQQIPAIGHTSKSLL